MVKRALVPALVLLLLLPLSSAFSVSFTAINNSISPDQTAAFALTIVNTKGFEDTFRVSTRDPEWILSTEPPLAAIPSLSTRSYVLYIKPKQGVGTGPHAVPVKTKSLRSGQFREDNLLINIKPDSPFGGEYAPAVKLAISIDSIVNTSEKIPVSVELSNKNPRDMPDLKMIVDGGFFHREVPLHLSPLEEKSRQLLFDPAPQAPAGIHTLAVKLVLDNITIAEATRDFEVRPVERTGESVEKEASWFLITKEIKITNEGNQEKAVSKKMEVPFFLKPFISFEPEPEKIGGEYVWSERLAPGESFTVVMRENYRSLVLILLVLIVGIAAYFIFRSPVVLTKEASMDDELIKVTIYMRNRSGKVVGNVTVLDKVPPMGDFQKKSEPGTMKPTKVVKSTSKGTSIRWEVQELDPLEERIITYRMSSKLKLVGGINLQPAKAKFETEGGKERGTYSNSASIVQ